MASKTPPRHLTARTRFREVWLTDCLDKFIRPRFKRAGLEVPEHVRISSGWPSKGGLAVKKRVIGQAWSEKASADSVKEIIISVYLDDPIKVIGVLVHEVIHVTIGNEHGHKKPFVDAMALVGLCGKPTATDETEELKAAAAEWVKVLGPYPGAKLDGLDLKKQSTRLILMECDKRGGCGLKIRTTRKWLDMHGPAWPCPCGKKLHMKDADLDDDGGDDE